MPVEIERKFRVKKGSLEKIKVMSTKSLEIRQGYLSSNPERTVRLRIQDDKAFLTIKGKSNEAGLSRLEFEYEIPIADAEEMFKFCEAGIISKTRYLVPVGNHTFEVDVFHGDNEGLIIAEIELGFEDEIFEKPEWLDSELTGDLRYYNSALLQRPYMTWNKK